MRDSRLKKTLLLFIGLNLASIILSMLPVVQDNEEDLGLGWLFQSRGIRPAPEAVVVISIDKSSSRHYGLPNLARKWPRSLHTRLLEKLQQAGVKVVAFDVHFKAAKDPQQDAQLAGAIRNMGNIVLFTFLQKSVVEAQDLKGRVSRLVVDELVPPLSVFADAAMALAPNPLPKVPVKVSQFWKFVPEAGDAPTLPVVAYQYYLKEHLPVFVDMLAASSKRDFSVYLHQGDVQRQQLPALMLAIHESFQKMPELEAHIVKRISESVHSTEVQGHLHQMLRLYADGASQYINYYGPARSIMTLPFYEVLESDRYQEVLKDKFVFVGFSEHRQWEQQDGFYSVYSNEEGLDISGVEITATAAANLLSGTSVKPLTLGMRMIVLLMFSCVLILVFYRIRGVWLPVTLLLAAFLYYLLASRWFAHDGTWLPLVVPLLVQIPIVMLIGMIWNYQELNRERKNIQRAFGFYLPENEVDRLARDITSHNLGGQLMHGTCLSTDAQQYTRLSEKMSPQELTTFMNAYYESIFKPVRQCAGIISDVVGDSVMALWASPSHNRQQREHAIAAALQILDSVATFNHQHPDNELPTRIGLHYGSMVIGNVGAVDHYEYRAVGDIVNTTSRIEGLSKYLGVRLLASADVLEDLQGFDKRYVGRFVLKGKTVGIPLYEIAAMHAMNREARLACWQQFSEAFTLFEQGEWTPAHRLFEQLLGHDPDDGPTQFYRDYCQERHLQPPENWQGTIHMEDK